MTSQRHRWPRGRVCRLRGRQPHHRERKRSGSPVGNLHSTDWKMLTLREDALRVDALHRRLANDVKVMYDAVSEVLPARMPKCYESRAMNVRPFLDKLNDVCAPFNVFNEIKE